VSEINEPDNLETPLSESKSDAFGPALDTENEVMPVVAPTPTPRPTAPRTSVVPIPVTVEEIYSSLPEPAGPAVVGLGEVDDVSLSSCVYKNVYARKSLTVHHLQRRLVELGYTEANRDKDGYYGDLTRFAIAKFQSSNGIEGDGLIDAVTFALIFKGDPNVRILD
jgi:hypothetical protein